MNDVSRLVLGTAQLGMDYGVANTTGKPDQGLANEIVAAAWDGGIRCFDTAQVYGDSEAVLGQALAAVGASDPRIVSKISLAPDSDGRSVDAQIQQSLDRLQQDTLYCMMLHRQDDLPALSDVPSGIPAALTDKSKIRHLGVSVYDVPTALSAIALDTVEALQIPANVFDQRFLDASFLQPATAGRIGLYVRSVFLQGILVMPPEAAVRRLGQELAPWVQAYHALVEGAGLRPEHVALSWCKAAFPKASILFGAETPQQVEANIRSWTRDMPEALFTALSEQCNGVPYRLIDPRNWN